MATEVRCNACGGTFQHDGAGQSVQCPYCQATIDTSAATAGSSPSSAGASQAAEKTPAAAAGWHVYTCDGQRFGPITKEELDRWAEEKRLTASCQVYQDGWPTWRLAREFYPNLPPATGAGVASAAAPNIGAAAPSPTPQKPYAAPLVS